VEKAGFKPRTLGTKAERSDHCATRPVCLDIHPIVLTTCGLFALDTDGCYDPSRLIYDQKFGPVSVQWAALEISHTAV
jgi:hypothetical protein